MMKMQGRPQGGKNRSWSKEEKLKVVKDMLENNMGECQAGKKYHISHGMAGKWRRDYLNHGEQALENQKKPGNPLCKYANKKNLTELEKVQYENMKLRIENERLKKGYQVKGDGTIVVFKK